MKREINAFSVYTSNMNSYLKSLPEEIEEIIYKMAHEMEFAKTVKELKLIDYYCNLWGSTLHYKEKRWNKSSNRGMCIMVEYDQFGPTTNRFRILP